MKLIDFDAQDNNINNIQLERILYQIFNAYQKNNQTIQPFYFAKIPEYIFQFFDQLIIFSNKQVHQFQIEQTQIVFFQLKISHTYYMFGVHLIKNQIIEYKLDLEQLSILKVVDLRENEIIRPIEYQINENYFSIGVRNDMKTYILLFAIQKQQSLKLLNTIQIARDSFFFQKQYLIYYDKEDNLMIFNMADFEIQIENVRQFKSQRTSFNFNVFIIHFKQISIYCYELLKTTNNASLYYSFQNKTKILPTKYFQGPIDTLKILENDIFQIEGPLLVSKVSLEVEEAKVYTINLSTIFTKTKYFRIIYLSFQNSTMLFFNKESLYNIQIQENILLLDIILVNPQQILMILKNDKTEIFRGVIYQIDEVTHQLQKEPRFDVQLDLDTMSKEFQCFKTGNLIFIKGLKTQVIYQIVGFSLKSIPNKFDIIEILKIKGDNQLYVSLSIKDNYVLFFQILLINEFQLESKVSTTLYFENILNQLINHIMYQQIISLYNFRNFQFLECLIEDGQVKITGLQMNGEISVISEIIIQMEDSSISYKLLKITRINIKPDRMQQVYYCQNKLILRFLSGETYFYDLTGDQVITDYMGRQTGLWYSYHVLNTTHVIIYSYLENKIVIAEIGYEIHVNEGYSGNHTFTLVAENKLSQIQINLTIIDINHDQIKDQNVIIIYLLIFILALVLYYLIRRMKLKCKSLNTQKINGIELNNQEQCD
ncbi:unnamed protein product (macronuclear) [Paramecium tetraurelia]|uniref:Transmembrane protein n=1 Tax=Paramecium tetraurelia TaxID=5888 RepID=A0BEU8_PARTE|nr:uncharacterized protein GSPATT00028098001 [Paramecium tetraurelia]CAK57065.1 unnamed protein product [Paramecium tetraurelia]|eukprot:XP_001424463.1 hypothetical protein (macronuclear) [Paramecium tetraurelia strain d4-2]